MRKIFNILFIVFVAILTFFYREDLKNTWVLAYNRYLPCRSPISYSIGTFDQRFGISREDFLEAIRDAEKIWESQISKDLFKYSDGGVLKINLIYDKRQDTTVKLNIIEGSLTNTRSTYDSLKSKYEALLSSYNQEKISLQSRVSIFESRRIAYESEVRRLNKKGGATKDVYNKLNIEKDYLNSEAKSINQLQDSLNTKISTINSLASDLNSLAKELNINVDKYNTIGQSLGREFDEGVYRSSGTSQEIDIYQFENRTKLVRVLAHEFGHALGLDHNEDPKAIMYRLNNGINEKLTNSDLSDLKKICGIN